MVYSYMYMYKHIGQWTNGLQLEHRAVLSLVRFEVTMYDAIAVDVLEGQHCLREVVDSRIHRNSTDILE